MDRAIPISRVAAVRAGEVHDQQRQRQSRVYHGGKCGRHRLRIAPDIGVVVERICKRDLGPEGCKQGIMLCLIERREGEIKIVGKVGGQRGLTA